jgi:microcystin-dependent protein
MSDTISPLLQILLDGRWRPRRDWGDQTNTNLQKLEAAISGQNGRSRSRAERTRSTTTRRAISSILAHRHTRRQSDHRCSRRHEALDHRQPDIAAPSPRCIAVNGGSSISSSRQTRRPVLLRRRHYALQRLRLPVPDTGRSKHFAGSSAPLNHLLCNGQAVSRTTYAALFAVIGTTYGAGDGSTTFNLPDLRGRAPVGLDNMGGSAAAGSPARHQRSAHIRRANAQLLTSEIPAHAHGVTDPGHAHAITDPGHSHTIVKQTGAINTGLRSR